MNTLFVLILTVHLNTGESLGCNHRHVQLNERMHGCRSGTENSRQLLSGR